VKPTKLAMFVFRIFVLNVKQIWGFLLYIYLQHAKQ